MLTLINPVARAAPFDHPDWVFVAKFDGFRAAADTRTRPFDLAHRQPMFAGCSYRDLIHAHFLVFEALKLDER